MTPRQPTGQPPGRRHAEDQAAVRRVVRSVRMTQAEADALDARGLTLRGLVTDALKSAHGSTNTPDAPQDA